MNQEVTRRHYLDAMGITAWASKYQLPNALPTDACEWEESKPDATPPRERLQALLDDAPAPRRQAPEPQQAPGETIASPAAVRALLVNDQQQAKQPRNAAPTADAAVEVAPTASAKPLTFTLSCLCMGGRWLVLQAGEMSAPEQRLLANICTAVGIQQDAALEVMHFTWPPMVNTFAVEDPLDEAREGLAAFIAGCRSRQGWQLERLLWWGELGAEQAPLERILNVAEGYSDTLSLPVWQGPALGSLLGSASSKRELLPALQALGEEWSSAQRKTNDH